MVQCLTSSEAGFAQVIVALWRGRSSGRGLDSTGRIVGEQRPENHRERCSNGTDDVASRVLHNLSSSAHVASGIKFSPNSRKVEWLLFPTPNGVSRPKARETFGSIGVWAHVCTLATSTLRPPLRCPSRP
jgi:hypothetical protein